MKSSDIAKKASVSSTYRPTVQAMEELMQKPKHILDHGFIRVVDYMGDDGAIVQAARVSYGKGTRRVSEDRGLVRYLMRHRHSSPFEMCELKLHVKLPIFIARQWIRHRTANVNEYSARYSVLDKEFYLPSPDHMAVQSAHNKQGRGEAISQDKAAEILEMLKMDATRNWQDYETMLNPEKYGLARELARMNLTLNMYTQWYWKIDLHNLMHFLALRIDSHAQYEIRVYAQALMDILRAWLPLTAEAFQEYQLGSYTFSATMLKVIRKMIHGQTVTQEDSGLTKREWGDMLSALQMSR